MLKRIAVALFVACVGAWLSAPAKADTMVSVDSSTGAMGAFTVSSTDLINNGQSTLSSIALTSGTACIPVQSSNSTTAMFIMRVIPVIRHIPSRRLTGQL